jgi:hypothetical protein
MKGSMVCSDMAIKEEQEQGQLLAAAFYPAFSGFDTRPEFYDATFARYVATGARSLLRNVVFDSHDVKLAVQKHIGL